MCYPFLFASSQMRLARKGRVTEGALQRKLADKEVWACNKEESLPLKAR